MSSVRRCLCGRSTGFTLIELVAATALTAVLAITAMYVIASLRQRPQADSSLSTPSAWTEQLRDRVRWDLTQAVALRLDPAGMVMAGYGSIDAVTREPTHRPVTVSYSLKSLAGHSWLIREQTDLNILSAAGSSTEWLLVNVSRFEITPLPPRVIADAVRDPVEDKKEAVIPLPFARLQTLDKVPRAVRLMVECEGGSAPVVDTVLFLK